MSVAGMEARYSDLKSRVTVGLALSALALVALWLGGFVFTLFVALLVGVMMVELARMIAGRAPVSVNTPYVMAGLGAAGVVLAGMNLWSALALVLVGLIGVLAVNRGTLTRGMGLGYLWIAVAGAGLVFLRGQEQGFWVLLWLILAVATADMGGYFFGRQFGGPKLWPAVSPKKTWSGFLGGLFLALLVSLALAIVTSGSLIAFAVLGLLLAAIGVGGDLLESAAKRHFGIKDSGTILGGHGGLLDRFDALGAASLAALILSIPAPLASLLGLGL